MSAVSSCSSGIRGEAMAAKASILIYLEPRETCLVAMIFVLFVQLESSPSEPRKPRIAVAFNFSLSIICKHIKFCCLGTRLVCLCWLSAAVMTFGNSLSFFLAAKQPLKFSYGAWKSAASALPRPSRGPLPFPLHFHLSSRGPFSIYF